MNKIKSKPLEKIRSRVPYGLIYYLDKRYNLNLDNKNNDDNITTNNNTNLKLKAKN